MSITWTPQQLTDIAEILGTNSRDLSDVLDYFRDTISSTDQTSILARVTDYQAIEDDNVDIDPNIKNFGARISADKKRSMIKNRIANLLHYEISSGSGLVRG